MGPNRSEQVRTILKTSKNLRKLRANVETLCENVEKLRENVEKLHENVDGKDESPTLTFDSADAAAVRVCLEFKEDGSR